MNRYVCIHCHFYQPPREHPWFGEVVRQDSAYPFHDWNERITTECYATNTTSQIIGPHKEVIDTINNYEKVSFNYGPTLLSWLQKRKPEIYSAIIDADKESQKNFSGHGSAIAQVYNHIIMPLANRRDKETQVYWGIKDFVHRFGRYPEGIWLSETAVDLETLETVAEQGIKFTILSPSQVLRVRKIGDTEWNDLKGKNIDTSKTYLCRLASGKSINLFFYNDKISQGIAFGDLLLNGENFAKRLTSDFSENNATPELMHVATDGETYGHHRRYGNMALAYCIYNIEKNNLARFTIYGEYLEKHPPEYEVGIAENSSWSCVHGVERWRNNCGCNCGNHSGWNQEWRKPLREAMDRIQKDLINIFEEEMSKFVHDPWKARNDYIETILDASDETLNSFLTRHTICEVFGKDKTKILKLLEMQKYAMFMYTSCGWFFDDISRIEAVQVMLFAARAMQLAGNVTDVVLESEYINILKRASSNIYAFKSGDKVYDMLVTPTIPVNYDFRLYERLID